MIDQPMDETTLEALSYIVCGDEQGTKYRKGHEIAPFFRKCGLQSSEHDGSTRWRWTLEQLQIYNQSR